MAKSSPRSNLTMKLMSGLLVATAMQSNIVTAADEASSWQCTPIQMIHTRAVSSPAVSQNGSWTGPKFPVENANNANLWGALKFIMTETIDAKTGAAECKRKNGVAYVDFYLYKVCNPVNATWWFSPLKPEGYGGQPTFNYNGFGQYVAFDDGGCHADDPFCQSFNGNATFPGLGNYLGWQNQSVDARAPTPESYWYSLPGSCPEKTRSSNEKTPACIAAEPSGLCAAGVEPDGKNCTYSYEFLGEVVLDELVGITAMGYKDYAAFCKAGEVEFERDPTTYSFIRGLPFWNDSTSPSANRKRVETMLTFYANSTANPLNKQIPTAEELNAQNPPCYCNFPQCATRSCRYDESQVCVPCSSGQEGCESAPDASKCKHGLPTAQAFTRVEVPKAPTTPVPTTSGSGSDSPSSGPSSAGPSSGQDAPTTKSDGMSLKPTIGIMLFAALISFA